MGKLIAFAGLLTVSALAAALFGALHNQVSYGVAPEYFHDLKFRQFRIPAEFHNRIGAGIVGAAASWWMGLLIGLPVLGLALWRVTGTARFVRVGGRAIALVLLTTGLTAGLALALASALVGPNVAAQFSLPAGVSDPVAFVRAGAMHEGSYAGGLLGMIGAMIYVYRSKGRG